MLKRVTVNLNNGDTLKVSLGEFVAYERASSGETEFIKWKELPLKLNEVKQWEIWKEQSEYYERFIQMIGDDTGPISATGQVGDMTFEKAGRLAYNDYFCRQRGAYPKKLQLQVLNGIIGNLMVSTIDARTFSYVARKLRLRSCSNNTINKYYATVNKTLENAFKGYGTQCSPIHKMALPIPKSAVREISRSEEARILEWFKERAFQRTPRTNWTSQDLIDIYHIGIMTGMRKGEIFAFKLSQVKGQKLILTPDQHKTGDRTGNKVIILSKDAVLLIESRIERLGLKEYDRVFGHSKDAFSRIWFKMKKEIGLEEDRRFTPHCMRHTFASRMAEKGVPIYHVSKMLGHTTVKTTEMYAHLFSDELVRTINTYT